MLRFTRVLTILTALILTGHLTACSQTDSTRCFTIEEQRIIVKKIVKGQECIQIHNHLVKELEYQDSIIRNNEAIVGELEAQKELLALAYSNEKESREAAEKKLMKSNRRLRTWRNLTGIVGVSGIAAYLLKGM